MVPIKVMIRGKWRDCGGLASLHRGQAFKLKTGPKTWGHPMLAQSNAYITHHPANEDVLMWRVDTRDGPLMTSAGVYGGSIV
jgi:hypothetical protein